MHSTQHTLVFMHIAPYIRSFDEPDGYFNLPNKAAAGSNEVSGVRQHLMSLYARHGVTAVFCGHYHRNAGGWYEERDGASVTDCVEVVVTGAVGTNVLSNASAPPGSEDELNICGMGAPTTGGDVSGMRIVEVDAEAVRHRWYTLNEIGKV
jgi:hypothetical protein